MADRPLVPVGENDGYPLLGTAVSFLTMTWISVLLRTYVRAVLTKNFEWDDWLLLVAQVSNLHPQTLSPLGRRLEWFWLTMILVAQFLAIMYIHLARLPYRSGTPQSRPPGQQ
jgi:hypothetical protein